MKEGYALKYDLLKGEIDKQKRLQKLTNADLAKMTGYAVNTIDQFMGGSKESENVAKAIAAVLKIGEHVYSFGQYQTG